MRVFAYRGLKEIFELHKFETESIVGAGYFPLPAVFKKLMFLFCLFLTGAVWAFLFAPKGALRIGSFKVEFPLTIPKISWEQTDPESFNGYLGWGPRTAAEKAAFQSLAMGPSDQRKWEMGWEAEQVERFLLASNLKKNTLVHVSWCERLPKRGDVNVRIQDLSEVPCNSAFLATWPAPGLPTWSPP